jgi:glycosyltransferase involved in cell wall biosynthesis
MRIVLDLQPCQTENSADRGVGRSSWALAEAMVRTGRDHEYFIVINGSFPIFAEKIRGHFLEMLPGRNIRTFDVSVPVEGRFKANNWRRRASELVREKFITDLAPDAMHIGNLFEGFVDNAVTSIATSNEPYLNAVTLHDLIPLINPIPYLENPDLRIWYYQKLNALKRADLLLSVSNSSRLEALDHLGIPPERVCNISSAVDPAFKRRKFSASQRSLILNRVGLNRQTFVMYTGGIDYRKNMEGLIYSYSKLSPHLRKARQLAIVCSISEEDRTRLCKLAVDCGLDGSEVVFTGFIRQEDLIALYNLCELFIFPSLHEGFGLPVLEAMACGAPTIGANNSSIPEVIGLSAALFDARNPASITEIMTRVLDEPHFAQSLRGHSVQQAAKFSWTECAKRALDAIEEAHARRQIGARKSAFVVGPKPRLAFITPAPPLQTGIANYSAELIPELCAYYDIDVITNQESVTDPWMLANCQIRTVEQFEACDDAEHYDRIVYQMGNSDFHGHMFDLLIRRPGTVVLHDLFLSGIQHWREHHHGRVHHFARTLVESHGYRALIDHVKGTWDAAIWGYPCNAQIAENAAGIIVHSRGSADGLRHLFGLAEPIDVCVIPHLRAVPQPQRVKARQRLGLGPSDFLICSFGFVGLNKLSRVIFDGFLASALAKDANCRLVFVGDNPGEYGASLDRQIQISGLSDRLRITGFVDTDMYRTYLSAADTAIQLRTVSRGETSGAVLDCAAYRVPLIINAHGTMAEIPSDTCVKLPDSVTVADVASALEALKESPSRRQALAARALDNIRHHHAPSEVARSYYTAIESYAIHHPIARERRVIQSIMRLPAARATDAADVAGIAKTIFVNRHRAGDRRLFLDISELVRRDWKSGIQRVVRAVAGHLLQNSPMGWRVEPVYLDQAAAWAGYRYARRFTSDLVGYPDSEVEDDIVEPTNGDCFLGLDLFPNGVRQAANKGIYRRWRARGVAVYFVVYDLLPVLKPQYFVDGAYEGFAPWLDTIAFAADGLICISRAVADETIQWLKTVGGNRQRPLNIGYFHLGSDGLSRNSVRDSEVVGVDLVRLFAGRPTALMVGTLEPRKGHLDVVTAFEKLWEHGVEANLFIVGKQGWLAEGLVAHLSEHPERNRRLFWRPSASDMELEEIYAACTGLIAASYAEGFGLPLIEAAEHSLPILARDIPVFREVAGKNAEFFPDGDANIMAISLEKWLARLADGTAISSTALPRQDWAQATDELVSIFLGQRWLTSWNPEDMHVYRADHLAVRTDVGERAGGYIGTTGKAGFLIYGPYIALSAGQYEITLSGLVGSKGVGRAIVDFAVEGGSKILYSAAIHKNVPPNQRGAITEKIRISLSVPCKDFEARLSVDETSDIQFSRIEIRPHYPLQHSET